MPKRKSLAYDFFVAGVIVLIALLLMLGLDPWLEMTSTPFLIFFGAVPLAALNLGKRGGIIASCLSAVLANYFFITPKNLFTFDTVATGRTLIFLSEGILISILIGMLRQSQRQTRESLHQLKASEAKFRRLVDSNIIGVAVCDIYGGIRNANDILLNSLGYTREDLWAGRIRWDAMTPADLKHLDGPAVEELITKGRNTAYEKAFIGKQGQRVPVVVGNALLEDDPEQVISFILDITERKRVEQHLAIQYAIARVLAESSNLASAIPLVLQSLCESLNWQLGFFWQVNPQTHTLQCLHSWHSPGLDATPFIQATQEQDFQSGVGLPGRIWKSGQSLWITHLAEDPNFPRGAIALSVGLQSAFGFPISLNQEVLGIIECCSTQTQAPDDPLLHLMDAIGSQIGQFIERKQTEEELQASQALFQSFMNHCPINAFIKDDSGHFLYVNPTVERTYNRPLVDWVGKTDFDFFPHEIAEAFRANDEAVLQTGRMTETLETNPLDDDKSHYLSFKFPIRDVNGRLLIGGMALNISDRKRFEAERERLLQQLEVSVGQLEAVINNMTEGLVMTDFQGNILAFNPAALAMHGYESFEQVQRHLQEFPEAITVHDLESNFVPLEQWPISRALRGEIFSNYEIEVHQQETGKHFIGSYGGTPIYNKQGQLILAIVTLRDVTEQRQAQAELARSLVAEKAARNSAEAANRIKDEFLAVLSHELRTPLNPILGWTKLLRKGKLNPQKIDFALETIERNTQLQIQLIEDLLDISRILQGKLTLNVSQIDLGAIIEAAKETVRLAAEAKSIDIQTELAPSRPVLGDGNRLQQVVWNLLSNAVKFTPEGGKVEIRLSLLNGHSSLVSRQPSGMSIDKQMTNDQEQMTNYAQIQVCDTGKGISPEFLPHIFEYFTQADSSITRRFGGLGLGLAIAHRIVELHGGTIRAESQGEGQGATFTVTLPLLLKDTEEEPEAAGHGAQVNESFPLDKIQVLVVDDEADNLELMKFILEQAGAKVVTCTSAVEGLQQFTELQPDILVTDIGMPEMDGYTLIRKIRELPLERGGQIPAIALTAYAAEFDQQQAIHAGFQQHLAKPVEPEALVRAIATFSSAI